MERIEDGNLVILAGGPAGDFANNIYIVIDRTTNEAAFVDAPAEPEKAIAMARDAGVEPGAILLTHSHGDHTAGISALKTEFGCKLYADPREPWLVQGQLDHLVSHGDDIPVGRLSFRVLSVPGHTPGSTSYVHGLHAFVGDTLFPGGPGRSASPEALQEEISSITTYLYGLADETVIYPGHGARTTIGESKQEYAVFAAKEHDPGLHGDVLWASS
ncbi:MAG: hydroxyacylglutathione hydrolase family protein [Dehalococcoidia bacterium]|nr:hydroxyacylglutathione hydrolase family protein [Dehalococcoidia bacterium]